MKKQNYKVEQKLNISTKPRSSTPVGTSYPPFAMSAISPIALQDDISATYAALPSKDHYTSSNETLKGPGMAAGTVTFHEPNLKVQGPLALSPGIVTFYEPSLELQKPVAPPPGTVDFQEPNLKVQGFLAPPQIGALSNDVLQLQEQSETSLTTTPSTVNWTTTGPMKQAVQGANVAHQTYSSPIPAMHPFNIPTPNLVSYPGQGLPTPLPPCPGPGAHTLCVNKFRQYWCACCSPGPAYAGRLISL